MGKPVMIITGASSGIGAATARRMARDGYRLVLAARREERLTSLAAECQALGGDALALPTDVTSYEDLHNMVRAAVDRWGRVDILFNNAGVCYDKILVHTGAEKIRSEVETNLTAVILAAQAVLPVMLRQRSGHIINTASIAGLVATPGDSIYCATKFGVVGFSDSLRRELRGTGVRISAFCPGYTASEITQPLKAHYTRQSNAPRIPGLMPTEYVAGQVAALIHRPRRVMVIPKLWRPMIFLANFFPGITDLVVRFFL